MKKLFIIFLFLFLFFPSLAHAQSPQEYTNCQNDQLCIEGVDYCYETETDTALDACLLREYRLLFEEKFRNTVCSQNNCSDQKLQQCENAFGYYNLGNMMLCLSGKDPTPQPKADRPLDETTATPKPQSTPTPAPTTHTIFCTQDDCNGNACAPNQVCQRNSFTPNQCSCVQQEQEQEESNFDTTIPAPTFFEDEPTPTPITEELQPTQQLETPTNPTQIDEETEVKIIHVTVSNYDDFATNQDNDQGSNTIDMSNPQDTQTIPWTLKTTAVLPPVFVHTTSSDGTTQYYTLSFQHDETKYIDGTNISLHAQALRHVIHLQVNNEDIPLDNPRKHIGLPGNPQEDGVFTVPYAITFANGEVVDGYFTFVYTAPVVEQPIDQPQEEPAAPLVCQSDDDFTDFVGCNPQECSKEFYRCPGNGEVREYGAPQGGDCTQPQHNPACQSDNPAPTETPQQTPKTFWRCEDNRVIEHNANGTVFVFSNCSKEGKRCDEYFDADEGVDSADCFAIAGIQDKYYWWCDGSVMWEKPPFQSAHIYEDCADTGTQCVQLYNSAYGGPDTRCE